MAHLIERLAHDLYRKPPGFEIVCLGKRNSCMYSDISMVQDIEEKTRDLKQVSTIAFTVMDSPTGHPSFLISVSSLPRRLADMEAMA